MRRLLTFVAVTELARQGIKEGIKYFKNLKVNKNHINKSLSMDTLDYYLFYKLNPLIEQNKDKYFGKHVEKDSEYMEYIYITPVYPFPKDVSAINEVTKFDSYNKITGEYIGTFVCKNVKQAKQTYSRIFLDVNISQIKFNG